MSGTSTCPANAEIRSLACHDELQHANAELIRAIRNNCDKECFATDLRYVCVDFHCRWQDDCDRLSDG